MLGVDVSNYDGYITDAWVQCIKEQGIACAVVRLSLETAEKYDIALHQLDVFQRNGVATMGYLWEYTTENAVAQAQQALDWYGDRGVRHWWVDCEETKYILDPATNASWLNTFLQHLELAGCQTGIYTAPWWWKPKMENTDAFANRPLWYANYDGIATLNNPAPFGGWDGPLVAGKQYDGGSERFALCGHPVDRDVFDDGLLVTEDDMSQEERDELTNLRAYIGTLLGTDAEPGGVIGQNLQQMERAAGTQTSKLASVVRQRCAAIRQAAGI